LNVREYEIILKEIVAGHEIATTNFVALVSLSPAGLRWWTSTRGPVKRDDRHVRVPSLTSALKPMEHLRFDHLFVYTATVIRHHCIR
jgi:hypothetical protein